MLRLPGWNLMLPALRKSFFFLLLPINHTRNTDEHRFRLKSAAPAKQEQAR